MVLISGLGHLQYSNVSDTLILRGRSCHVTAYDTIS